MKKGFIFVGLAFLFSVTVNAQSFSGTYNPTLPVAYLSMLGYSSELPANRLFERTCFKTYEGGSVIVSLESSETKNGTFTGSIVLTKDGKKGIRFRISLRSDSDGDFNYITGLYMKDLTSGLVAMDKTYTGSQNSLGEMLGGLQGLFETDLIWDIDKLFAK
jgi:hypothetical protein